MFATIVSRPWADRAILDTGHKAMSDHATPPVLAEHPGSRILGLSAEHATVEVGPGASLSIGDKVRVIPGYSDFTFVLHDRVLAIRGGRVEASWTLSGRGMLQ